MKFTSSKLKRGLFALLFSLLNISCIQVVKTVTGFSNPEVLSLRDIKDSESNLFETENGIIDAYFTHPKDSMELYQVLANAFNGSLNIYDNQGNLKCLPQANYCGAQQFAILQSKSESTLEDCPENEDLSPYSTLNDFLTKISDIKTSKHISMENLPPSDYYLIYYWSNFMMSEKRFLEDFNWFKKNVSSLKSSYTIIRVNCDLIEEWGLEKGKKLKISFNKVDSDEYEAEFGEIPWEK